MWKKVRTSVINEKYTLYKVLGREELLEKLNQELLELNFETLRDIEDYEDYINSYGMGLSLCSKSKFGRYVHGIGQNKRDKDGITYLIEAHDSVFKCKIKNAKRVFYVG